MTPSQKLRAIAKVFRAQGYKTSDTETTAGVTKIWLAHPSHSHAQTNLLNAQRDLYAAGFPCRPGDFAWFEDHLIGSGRSFRVLLQGGGTLYIGVARNTSDGQNWRDGYDG
jgi:hypothetical protein